MTAVNDKTVRLLGALCHLSYFLNYINPVLMFAPVVVWLFVRKFDPFTDAHGKECVNYIISVFLYVMALHLFSYINFAILLGYVCQIPIVLAAFYAFSGKPFRYPLSIRFLNMLIK